MAKLPGWIREDGTTRDEKGQLWVKYAIRRWHPGLWLACAKDFIIKVLRNGRRSV